MAGSPFPVRQVEQFGTHGIHCIFGGDTHLLMDAADAAGESHAE